MTPAEFEQEIDRLWGQVKPLYDELHCYVRAQLAKTYGKDKIAEKGPIPAHLLGNMWAQEWDNIYPLVEPYQGQGAARRHHDAREEEGRRDEDGEARRGLLHLARPRPAARRRSGSARCSRKPRDREVVCHATAWDVTYDNDLRIKMCIKPTEEDLITIHHELGHDYYFHYYYKLPMLFQQGANDGFHEAIGDTLALSVTPEYLKKLGLLDTVPEEREGADQRADEVRAREGRVPPVRPAHRPVALGRVRRARPRRPSTTKPGGSCA